MKFTNEQLIQIGRDVVNEMLPHLPNGITWVNEYRGDEKAALLAAGRAAVAAAAPLLLAEAAPSERKHIGDVIFQSGHEEGLRVFLANRLASVTAKPDPAPDALRNELRRQANKSGHCLATGIDYDALVAAVDAARELKP